MFGFLKEKLKGAIARISKKVEEASPKEELKEQFEIEKKPKTEEKIKKELLEIQEEKEEFKAVEEPKKTEVKKEKKPKKVKIEEIKEEILDKELEEHKIPIGITDEIVEAEKEILEEPKMPAEEEVRQETVETKAPEKKGFFGRLKEKFVKKEEEKKVEEEIKEVEEKGEAVETETKQEAPKAELKTTEEKQPEVEVKKGFFGIIKEKITTTKISEEKFEDLFYELELALLENNVAFEVVDKIKSDLKKDLIDKPIKRGEVEGEIKKGLKESIEDLFLTPRINLIEKIKESKKPYVICFVGQNGSGKTTSIAKVGNLLKKSGFSVVFAAGDTFRKAAIEQIKEWGNRLEIRVIAHDYGSDSAAVIFDSISYAKAHKIDVVLIDTAGRQHTNKDLMNEMKKIIKVNNPDLKIFVGEAITGNDCVEQCKEFNEALGIDGIILAKADVDEKGGAMISASYITHRPIMYLGTGQSTSDLKEFNSDEIIKSLGL